MEKVGTDFPEELIIRSWAVVLQKQQKWQEALGKWETVLEQSKNKAGILQNKVHCLMQLELFSEAEEIYKTILKDTPVAKFALVGLARIADQKENLEEAESRWQKLRRNTLKN